jgi:Mn2+/Fe2+ NRAMP family transporter
MGVKAAFGRLLAAPLLLFNLACSIIILGLAGYYLDKYISNPGALTGAGFGGNGATLFLVIFSIIAAMLAIAAYLACLHHLRVWTAESGAAASAVSWVAWLLLIVAFCLAWKEIHIGHRGTKLKVLEAFVIILTVTHFIYTIVLHIGDKGSDANNQFNRKPLNPNAPAHNTTPAASAV